MASNQYKVYVIDGLLTENEVRDMLMKSGVVSHVDDVDSRESSSGLVQAIFSSKPAGGISISDAVTGCFTNVPSRKVKVLPADVCKKAVVHISDEWHAELTAHRVRLDPLLSRGVSVKETPQELTLEGNWKSVCEALGMIESQLVQKWREPSAQMEKDAQVNGIKSHTDPTTGDDDIASHQKRVDDDQSGAAASSAMVDHSVPDAVAGTVDTRLNSVNTAVKTNQVREIDDYVWIYIKARFAEMASYFETKLSPVGFGRSRKIQLSGQSQELHIFEEFYQQHQLESVVERTIKLPDGWDMAAVKDVAGELNVVTCDFSANDNSCQGIGRRDDLANFVKFVNDGVTGGDVSQVSNQLPTAKTVAQSMAGVDSSAKSSPPARLIRHTGDSLVLETPGVHLTVSIMRGDLTKQKAEVIVNPANSRLQHHGGAAKAIADAAGYKMQWACEDYILKYHRLPVSEVIHTTAGNLKPPIKHIIHACGPMYKKYQDETDCKRHLERTFHNCLVYANDNLSAKSIAIPAISAGTFGCPWDMVSTAAYNALMSFDSYMASLLQRQRHLSSIYFVNIDRDITVYLVDAFSELIKLDVIASSVPSTDANDNNGSTPVVGQRPPNVDGTGKDPAKCCVCGRSKILSKKDCGHMSCVSCKSLPCRKCAPAVPVGSKRIPADDTTTDTARPKSSLDAGKSGTGKSGTANDSAVTGGGSSFNRKRSGSFSGTTRRSSAGSKDSSKSAANGDSPIVDSSKDDDFDLDDSTPSPLRRHNSLTLHDRKKSQGGNTSGEMCAICMDEIANPKKLECGHKFCTDCINVALKHSNKCPCCGHILGKLVGNQPEGGTMKWRTSSQELAGFRGAGSIEITYDIPSGFQQDNHPNPGRTFRGTVRVAYLPNNSEGKEVLDLLREAFKARLVFTIGRSVTTGEENVVVWNDIHHKTSRSGQYGYPDYTYLTRVKQELAAKGIGVKGASPAAVAAAAASPLPVDDPVPDTARPLPPRTAWTDPTSRSVTTPRSNATSRSNSGSSYTLSSSRPSTAAAVSTCHASSRSTSSSATRTTLSVKGAAASTTSTSSSMAGGSLSSADFATSYPTTSTHKSLVTDPTRRDDFTSLHTSSSTRYPSDPYDYLKYGSGSSSHQSLPDYSSLDSRVNAVIGLSGKHYTGSSSRGSSDLDDFDHGYDRHSSRDSRTSGLAVHSSRSSVLPASSSRAGVGSQYGSGAMSSTSSVSRHSPTTGYSSSHRGSSSSYRDSPSSLPFSAGIGVNSNISRGAVYDTHARVDFRGLKSGKK